MNSNAARSVDPMSRSEVMAQLERLLADPQLRGCVSSARLLRYVVEQTLAGGADDIKEVVIAAELYAHEPGYDPKVNSSVRVEAGRLRARLARYYATSGAQAPIRIVIPKGTYVPRFERQLPRGPNPSWCRRRANGAACYCPAGRACSARTIVKGHVVAQRERRHPIVPLPRSDVCLDERVASVDASRVTPTHAVRARACRVIGTFSTSTVAPAPSHQHPSHQHHTPRTSTFSTSTFSTSTLSTSTLAPAPSHQHL